MGNALVDAVKAELKEAKLEPKCPKCGSKMLYGVWTRIFKLDLENETSEEIMNSGFLIDVYCDCGWNLNGHEVK